MSPDRPRTPSDAVHLRRGLFGGALLMSLALIGAKSASAAQARPRDAGAPPAPRPGGPGATEQDLLDGFAVEQVVLRERVSRETHDFDASSACFYPDAQVEVSWFKGSAADFVNAGRKSAAAGTNKAVYFDSMSPPLVQVREDRALADASCAVHTFLPLGGVEASMTSFTRLFYRMRKADGAWRILSLRAVYIRDLIEACNPVEIPPIDADKLKTYRPSYRHLSYILEVGGRPLRDDLPGVDRPASVAQLRNSDRAWLQSGG